MGRVEPLSGDIEIERFDEAGSDLLEDARGEVVLSEQLLVAFDGAAETAAPGSRFKAYWTSVRKM